MTAITRVRTAFSRERETCVRADFDIIIDSTKEV